MLSRYELGLKRDWFWRRATAQLRVLPDFILIGAQKCGSTSFYDYMLEHPKVFSSSRKAPRFFDLYYHKGINYYRAYFPYYWKLFPNHTLDRRIRVGEETQDYILHPLAPERMAMHLPDVKLIVLLRDPVDRAYSHWNHRRRLGKEPLSFEEAIAVEDEKIQPYFDHLDEPDYPHYDYLNSSYKKRGLYAEQLERWFEHFPREQFYIQSSEKFFAETKEVFNDILDFLDLPFYDLQNYKNSNPGDYDDLNPDTRAQLVDYFREPNQRLYDMLGVDYGWSR